jgi:hypothetical protein
MPWDAIPLSEPTPTIAPENSPDLTKTIYTEPNGLFALYLSSDEVGLWYVPSQGASVKLIDDGYKFIYVP